MNYLIQTINAPALSSSCAERIGRRLVAIGFGLRAVNGIVGRNTHARALRHVSVGADTVRSVL